MWKDCEWKDFMRTRDLIREKKKITKEILALQEEYDSKEEILKAQLHHIMEQLKMQCKHPEAFVAKHSSYCSGSYYDKEYWDEWRECSICGAKSEVKTTYGSYG